MGPAIAGIAREVDSQSIDLFVLAARHLYTDAIVTCSLLEERDSSVSPERPVKTRVS